MNKTQKSAAGTNSKAEQIRQKVLQILLNKSPSCTDAPGEEGHHNANPDNLQQPAEQQLGSADRLGDTQYLPIHRGSPQSHHAAPRSPSRGSYHTPGSPRQQSRIPSPRAASAFEDEAPRMSSPPASPAGHGSRGAGSLRAGSQSVHGQGASQRALRSPMYAEEEPPAGSAHHSLRGTPNRSVMANSRASGVTFSNKPSVPGVGTSCGGLAGSNTDNCVGYRGMGVDGATSAMGLEPEGVEAGVSAMTYVVQREGCVPGCIRFQQGTQEASTSMSRGMSKESAAHSHTPAGSCGHTMGSRTPPPSEHHTPPVEASFHSQGHPQSPSTRFGGLDGAPSPAQEGYMKPMSAGHEHHHHHHQSEGADSEFPPGVRDERVMAALGHLSQLKKTPSYYACGLNHGLDFLKACSSKAETGKVGRVAKFPEIPCLREEEIDSMIKCETSDVESAWFLTSEEKKTYKKPCPKQQKAQMSVKALVQAHANQVCAAKEYTPLEHPDPEDISPEVAAAMMFSQEKGIKMDDCPHYTITSLFPDEPKPPFPEKVPQSSISIVDSNSKDQDEMIEKSASISSEGVSDSAYTRTMKEKGEDVGPQRSFDVDFAIGQSKREYVLVTQKPQRVSKAQYRGGSASLGFPGYLSAFPDEVGLKVVASPSGIFQKAWIHSNPGNMPTSDVIVLD